MPVLSLTTFEAVRTLHGAMDTTKRQPQIDALIASVSRQIERYIGYSLYSQARTEQYDIVDEQKMFLLRAAPVSLLTSVKESSSRDFSGTAIADSNYHLDAEYGILTFDEEYTLLQGYGTLQVVYTAGLTTTAANVIANYPDLALACGMQVLHLFTKSPQFGASSKQGVGGSVAMEPEAGLIVAVRELLETYRRVA